MTDCTCRLEDGHLVPCPAAEELWDRVTVVHSYYDAEEREIAVVEARRAYEDHVVRAVYRLAADDHYAWLDEGELEDADLEVE